MSRRYGCLLLTWMCLLATAPPVRADPPRFVAPVEVAIRSGDHDGYGRVVIDFPAGLDAAATELNGDVVMEVSGAVIKTAARPPRNVSAITFAGSSARLVLVPGSTWHTWSRQGQLVVDVFDAPPAAENADDLAQPPSSPPLNSPPPPRHIPRLSEPIADHTAPVAPAQLLRPGAPEDAVTPPGPAVVAAPVQTVEKKAEPAGPLALAAMPSGASMSLPFAATTGAAAFRRDGDTVVVFDERRPLDLSALHDDPAFGTAQVQLLPAATLLRVALPAGTTLRLTHRSTGWTLTQIAAGQAPPLQPIGDDVGENHIRLAATAPGAVLSVPDPETGGALLVGTQQEPGEGTVVARRTPAFTLLATLQGVAVEPLSDAVSLHLAGKDLGPGFLLTAEGGRSLSLDPLDAGALAAAAAAHLTRRWDFPNLPIEGLVRRLQAATDEAAGAAPQGRGPRRLAAVQAELALGLGAEAHALATLAAAEDARQVVASDAAALDAVAALIAGRLRESDAISDHRIDGTDEVALWRAVRSAMLAQEGSGEPAPEAAAEFAATMPLILDYPTPLRERLLPLAAETMALGGQSAAAARLLDARKTDASLDYARALLDESNGHIAPALATLDRLAQSPDRSLRARAGVRATELRLRTGGLSVAQAADALDRQIYAWRGDARELALRLRAATLRMSSGNWRAALALLRETGGDISQSWPDQRDAIHARMIETFRDALAQDARAALPPLELVSLLEENPDLLPDGEAGRLLAARLADRLVALDLPARAMPVLDKLIAATQPGPARAELGSRLAALQLGAGDAHGALLTLSASVAADLPPDLTADRAVVFARATAANGDLAAAIATLVSVDAQAADAARAELLESAKDWPAAASALSSLAARTVPDSGPLDEAAARTLLRLASAAAQAGDEMLLARLRAHDLPRMPAGNLGDMLRMLTESPVQSVTDLPRAAQEATAVRALPSALSAMATPAAPH
jgi:hypothetical protein